MTPPTAAGRPSRPGATLLVTAPLPPGGRTGRPRLDLAAARLAETFAGGLERVEGRPVARTVLEKVHARSYLDRVERLRSGRDRLYEPHVILPGSLEGMLLSAGAAAEAVGAVVSGRARRALVLAEPPGHHAATNHGTGFCVFNNAAVAAATAREAGVERILVVDWDVHHGDGTQEILGRWPGLAIVDLHQHPLFPGTGAAGETGGGDVWNVPLPAGCGDADYAWLLERLLPAVARRVRPQLVLVSSGFDPHADDPLGGMRLTDGGFGALAALVADVADEHCDGRVVVLLEGGYSPPAVAGSVVEVYGALSSGEPPRRLGGETQASTVAALEATAEAHAGCCGRGMREDVLGR